MTKILDGKALSAVIRSEIKENLIKCYKKTDKRCVLAVVLVGEDLASQIYVRNKSIACEQTGITSITIKMSADSTQEEVELKVKSLCADNSVNGVLVQLPLPKRLDEKRILALIPQNKDVDGFSVWNAGGLFKGDEGVLLPCTPRGIIELLKRNDVELAGKRAVVVGRSNIVGKPLAMLLLNENCTVTICHSKTQNLSDITKQADILVCAIGKAKFFTKEMIKNGAVVVDVGMNRIDGKLCGDVDYQNVQEKTSAITPVPGGVGPMTITMLLYNTYLTFMRNNDELQ